MAMFTVMDVARLVEPQSASVVAQSVAYVLAGHPKSLREVLTKTADRLDVVAEQWRRDGRIDEVRSFIDVGGTISRVASEIRRHGEHMHRDSKSFGGAN